MPRKKKQSITDHIFENKAGVIQNIYYYVVAVVLMVMVSAAVVIMGANDMSVMEVFVIGNLCIFDIMIVYYLMTKADVYASISIGLVMINSVFVVQGYSTSAFTNISVVLMLTATFYIFAKHFGVIKC